MFSDQIKSRVTAVIDQRITCVADYKQRKYPILDSHKISNSAELASALLNCILTLSDDEKRSIIKVIESQISKS